MEREGKAKVLVVDDSYGVRFAVKLALENEGMTPYEAEDYYDAIECVQRIKPDLVILDIKLKSLELDGLDILQWIREQGLATPVIILTVIDRTMDSDAMQRALDSGANIYVTKRDELERFDKIVLEEQARRFAPATTEFWQGKSDIRELMAYVKARLNPHPANNDVASIKIQKRSVDEDLVVDLPARKVAVRRYGEWIDVALTRTEAEVLELLMRNEGRFVSGEILENRFGGSGSFYTRIYNLRAKIELEPKNPKYLLNRHGEGYSFQSTE